METWPERSFSVEKVTLCCSVEKAFRSVEERGVKRARSGVFREAITLPRRMGPTSGGGKSHVGARK